MMRKVLRFPSPTRRLTTMYIMALSTVALLTIFGQVLIQYSLRQQSSDALVINIAGRQRMLSQRISKAALALVAFPDAVTRQQSVTELQAIVPLWQRCQEGLQHGDVGLGLPGNNSKDVKQLFATLEPHYEAMLTASKGLLALLTQTPSSATSTPLSQLLPFVHAIFAEQSDFLVDMDHIVSQYQWEAEDRVNHLKGIELSLASLTLLVLLLEGLFVFRPVTQRLHQTIVDLVQAHERTAKAEFTRKQAERVLALNEALAASQQARPHARVVAFGHYQVRDDQGTYYDVYHREIEGQHCFACDCPQYQQQVICSHSLVAAALHSASGSLHL